MNNDPLLNNDNFYSYQDTSYEAELNRQYDILKRKRDARQKELTKQYQNSNVFLEIEKEFDGLNDEQRGYVYSDDDYIKTEGELQTILQTELIRMAQMRLSSDQRIKELIRQHIENIRVAKKQMNNQQSKEMAMFKEYTDKYSDMTYKEFLETKENQKIIKIKDK